MKSRTVKIVIAIILGLSAFAFGLLVVPQIPISYDLAFTCDNTGSQKGYREWFWVVKTDRWYTKSALEKFMEQRYPAELRHAWVSYKGDGHNFAGDLVVRGHASPMVRVRVADIDAYVAGVNDTEKKALYDCFARGDYYATRKRCEEIVEFLINSDLLGE